MHMQTPTFQKYVFRGSATALRGNIRKPYYQDLGRHLEIFTWAGSPVNIRCTNDGFAVGSEISYASATTSIVTTESGDFYECEAFSQVTGLNVAGRLSIDEVTSRLRSVYDKRSYPGRMAARVSPAGSTIKNLQVDKRPLELRLPAAFAIGDDEANEFLYGRANEDYERRFLPDVKLIPAPFAFQNFGTIYYAEWALSAVQEGHQHLIMLRLALGSDVGGDTDVGCTDNNGSGWPPLGS
jgi:hypothetical protein